MKELRIFKIFLKDDSDDKAPFDLVEKIQKNSDQKKSLMNIGGIGKLQLMQSLILMKKSTQH